jgi:hypothetical protein
VKPAFDFMLQCNNTIATFTLHDSGGGIFATQITPVP